jgi:two-component system chemotaxis response regulator CheB
MAGPEAPFPAVPPLAAVTALALASSTGGPSALVRIFSDLAALGVAPSALPPVFITQHMPEHFTGLLAAQIAEASGFDAREARTGEAVQAGRIYIAPGGYHMTVTAGRAAREITLLQTPPVHFCRPAADPMLETLAVAYGKNLLAVILTGMGTDGRTGCKKIMETGGSVIAQDAASSVVWGMPGSVVDAGCAYVVVALQDIAAEIARRMGMQKPVVPT